MKKCLKIFLCFVLIICSVNFLSACDNKTLVEDKISCSTNGWVKENEKDAMSVNVTFNTDDMNYTTFTKIQFVFMKSEDKGVLATAISEGQQLIKLLEWYQENWGVKVGNLTISTKVPSSSEYSHNDFWTYSNFDYGPTSQIQPKILKALIETESTRYVATYQLDNEE